MRGVRIGFILLLSVLSACNLGSNEAPTAQPTPTTIGDSASTTKPEIEIISPNDGAEYLIDEEVLVSVNASDSVGVTRVQLFANNQIVKTVSSPSIAGSKSLPSILNYTPRAEGDVFLKVQAFRGSIASDPAEITISVRGNPLQITATPNVGPGLPQIPNDGVCRALTNVNLNFREQPTTGQQNVIRVLPGGTLSRVIGKLSDNSWLKLTNNNQEGWVSGDFVTLYGVCSTVPVEQVATATLTVTSTDQATAPPTITNTPGLPDLRISNIVGEDAILIQNGETVTFEYTITITNIGVGPTGAFRLRVRLDDNVQNLDIANLNPNESRVISVDVEFDTVGEFDLIVRADPGNEISELDEDNNRDQLMVKVDLDQ